MTAYPPGKRVAVPYSSRLAWNSPENRLSMLRRRLADSGRQILDLTGTNPTTCGLGNWDAAIAAAMGCPGSALYQPDPAGLAIARAAVANDYATLGAAVHPDSLVLTASTSESYSFLFPLLCNPGDEILVPSPSYPLFGDLAGLAAVHTAAYHLRYAGEWWLDFASVEAAISPRTRALVVVNPNNPTGSYLRVQDAVRLMQFCAAHGLVLIADEVFWEYPLAAPEDRAWFAGGEDPPCLCVSLGGLSKSAGMPQMKLGWMLVRGPEEERARLLSRLHWVADTYLSVSTPVQRALPALLAVGAEIRQTIQERLRSNATLLRARLDELPLVSLLPAEGGWSAILRLPASHDDEWWCERLLEDAGVLLQPGYYFDLPGPSHAILSLLTPTPEMEEGLRRLAECIRATVADAR